MEIAFAAKLICDTSLWFGACGFLMSLINEFEVSLAPIGIIVLMGVCSALVSARRERLRLLPLIGLLSCLAFIRGVTDALLILPPCAYVAYLCATKRYVPDYDECVGYFKPLAILALCASALALVMGGAARLERYAAPYLVAFLCAGVLMLRMQRHDAHVRKRPLYAALNIASLCVVCALSFLVSTPWFLNSVGALFGFIYKNGIVPVLLGLAYVIMGACYLISKLFELIRGGSVSSVPFEFPLTPSVEEGGAEEIAVREPSEVFTFVISLIGVAAVILIAVILLRKLGGSVLSGAKGESAFERRERINEARGANKRALPRLNRSYAESVRYYYRKYLILIDSLNISIALSDTSESVMERCAGYFEKDGLSDMRELYIRARYGENLTTAEDVRRARALYHDFKREAAAKKKNGRG